MTLSDDTCLTLFERGAARHAIDRALLLAASGGAPPLAALDWADVPLGCRDAHLIALRLAWFGPHFDATLACPACGQMLTLSLDLRALGAGQNAGEPGDPAPLFALAPTLGPVTLASLGLSVRRPTSRDLAAVASARSVDEAAQALLLRLSDGATPQGGWTATHAAAADAALDVADPLARISVAAQCEHCLHPFTMPLDIAAVLWDELSAQARSVAQQVHALAGAYGWSERDILAMPPTRRALYLQQVFT